ncbi:MAG: response regulator [Candidatus Anammoximicrobium sp.]|nr:response regulator [Candidatus Anammoximicrobium sp.]
MLRIAIDNAKQQKEYLHESGPLVLGRQPGGDQAQVVIDDDYVSRRHLLLEEIPPRRLRFENFGRNDLELTDGTKIGRGACGETDLPARFRIGRTTIEVVRQVTAPLLDLGDQDDSAGEEFQTISLPATCQLPSVTRHSLASLGEVPSAEKLAVWFETLLSVQRAAVGSAEFYQETARAIVELVGLDRGLVLLREEAGWRIAAGWAKDQESGLTFSRSVLSRVVEQGRTFYGTPQTANARASLENVEAVVGSPIFGSGGEVVGVVYGSRDWKPEMSRVGIQSLEAQVVQLLASSVSAGLIRLEMQQRLQQVEQLAAVGQAIAYIVHDLRGPLGNVRQLLEMRRAGSQEGVPQEEQLDLIDQSLSVALDLLNDSFEFCRGKVRVQPVRGTFSELLGKHLRLLRLDLQMLGVDLQVDVPADLQVALDPERMARVLRNLARNAAEALQQHAAPVVTIGAQQGPSGEGVELYVADNGPGIPAEVLAKLFQPFSTYGKRGGTGFGLAIAKQLVEAHRGRISVVSSGQGTRFTIVLPPGAAERGADDTGHEPAAAQTGTFIASVSAAAPRRVLLAEDGAVNQRLIVGQLRTGAHEVRVVDNGRNALDAWESEAFDIVLMDVEMPELDGLAATREIRQREREQGRQSRTPIVALTAHASEESRAECLAAGMDAVLVKPITQDDLDAAIRRVTGGP